MPLITNVERNKRQRIVLKITNRHIPGKAETGGVTGLGAKFIIRLQFGRGQAILCEELLQMSKQLHGQRTYFLPGGALRIGCENIETY